MNLHARLLDKGVNGFTDLNKENVKTLHEQVGDLNVSVSIENPETGIIKHVGDLTVSFDEYAIAKVHCGKDSPITVWEKLVWDNANKIEWKTKTTTYNENQSSLQRSGQ